MSVRSANLGLRFVLELCALAALAIWGAQAGSTTASKILLAVVAPLLAALAWGLLVAPKAHYRLADPVRLIVEGVIFGLAVAGLATAGHTIWAWALAVAVLLNWILLFVWDQRQY